MRTKKRGATSLIVCGAMGALMFGWTIWLFLDYATPLLFNPQNEEGAINDMGLASILALALAGIMMAFVALLIFGIRAMRNGRMLKEINRADVKSAMFLANTLTSVVIGIMALAVTMNYLGVQHPYVVFLTATPLVSAVSTITFVALGMYWGTISAVVYGLYGKRVQA